MSPSPSLSIIGLGPRGISTLERLTAALSDPETQAGRERSPLTLHLIDDAGPGGRIWDPQQPGTFVMNTFAHGMMLFAEHGSTVQNPVVEGPTIFEWIQLAIGNRESVSVEKQRYFDAHPPSPELVERYGIAELSKYRPDSFLPRAIYGYYLHWLFDSLIARLPEWVTPVIHRSRALGIDSTGERDTIALSDASTVESDVTIAVTGWQAQSFNQHQTFIEDETAKHADLKWIAPDNPLEQDLDGIPAGENVFVRGLGMGFFDVLAATTEGRGGTFVEDPSTRSGLRYIATGNEPIFFASSNRGYPFLPQSDFGALPTPAELPRLQKVVATLSERRGSESIDYESEVFPALVRDAYQAYVDKLGDGQLRAERNAIANAIDTAEPGDLPRVIEELTTTTFDLEQWHKPLRVTADSAEELTPLVAEGLAADLEEAVKGTKSAVRAALWTIGCARKPTQILGAEGRYTASSRRLFDRMIALGQMACSGPPVFRTRQLLALIDASIVYFIGSSPSISVALDGEGASWAMASAASGNKEYKARVLVDAWVEKPDAKRPAKDPFVRSVFDTKRARVFSAPEPTASLELCPDTRRVIHPDGEADERLHFVGIPAHAQYPDTTISPPVPGTDPWFIQETDKAASSALNVLAKVGA